MCLDLLKVFTVDSVICKELIFAKRQENVAKECPSQETGTWEMRKCKSTCDTFLQPSLSPASWHQTETSAILARCADSKFAGRHDMNNQDNRSLVSSVESRSLPGWLLEQVLVLSCNLGNSISCYLRIYFPILDSFYSGRLREHDFRLHSFFFSFPITVCLKCTTEYEHRSPATGMSTLEIKFLRIISLIHCTSFFCFFFLPIALKVTSFQLEGFHCFVSSEWYLL